MNTQLRVINKCEVCDNETLSLGLDLGFHPMCADLINVGNPKQNNEYPIEIGIDTQSSINQGVLASQLGAIEIAKRYAERKNIQLDLILLSGGNGKQLLNHQDHSNQSIKSHYEDSLVLKGLMVWHQND